MSIKYSAGASSGSFAYQQMLYLHRLNKGGKDAGQGCVVLEASERRCKGMTGRESSWSRKAEEHETAWTRSQRTVSAICWSLDFIPRGMGGTEEFYIGNACQICISETECSGDCGG